MKTILVTGANGQLAKTIHERYSKNNDEIDFIFVSKQDLDITDKNAINSLFSKIKIDYCINCAAYTNVELAESEKDQAFKINAQAVENLALACKKHHSKLIHISTDYVFNGKNTSPYKETDQTHPINEYGKSKLLGEDLIQKSLKEYYIIRTSWLYSSYGNNFVKTIIGKIRDKKSLNITTTQQGTPTSCVDLADFIIQIINLKKPSYGIYHFSATNQATWYNFAIQIATSFEEYDVKNIKPVGFFPTKAKRPEYSVLDNSKAEKISGKKIKWQSSVNKVVLDLKKSLG